MPLGVIFAAVVSLSLCLTARSAQPLQISGSQTVIGASPTVEVPAYMSDFVLVKSEFVATPGNPAFGKDPFFPNTARFGPRTITSTETRPIVPATELTLKGIGGSKTRPVAIINNRTFAVGESAEMRVKGEVVKVRCIEITERVVKITVNGVAKDLPVTESLKSFTSPVIEKAKP